MSKYVIGSFNLRDLNFSNISNDDTHEKLSRDFAKIAEIIVKENFDVIALQEINAPNALDKLVYDLNQYKRPDREFAFCFGTDMPNQSGSKDPERYGFIWNIKRLRLLKTRRNNNPGYYQNAGAITLIRPPYYARFTARGMLGGANFELRLINTHILGPGNKESERIREFDILVKKVLPRICDHQEISNDGEIMPAYTFLMGDYNLVLNKSERSIYKIETLTTTNYTGRFREYKTVQKEATSLCIPQNQITIEDCYANNYDHFTYETDLENKLILIPQRIEALSKYFSYTSEAIEKLKSYRTKVSDHVPIKMTIDFK